MSKCKCIPLTWWSRKKLLEAISGFTRSPRQFVETALRGVLNCQQPTQAPPQSQQHLAAHVFHVK